MVVVVYVLFNGRYLFPRKWLFHGLKILITRLLIKNVTKNCKRTPRNRLQNGKVMGKVKDYPNHLEI